MQTYELEIPIKVKVTMYIQNGDTLLIGSVSAPTSEQVREALYDQITSGDNSKVFVSRENCTIQGTGFKFRFKNDIRRIIRFFHAL